jgi:hypothetical protein
MAITEGQPVTSQVAFRTARENGISFPWIFPRKFSSTPKPNRLISGPTTSTQPPAEFTQGHRAAPGPMVG